MNSNRLVSRETDKDRHASNNEIDMLQGDHHPLCLTTGRASARGAAAADTPSGCYRTRSGCVTALSFSLNARYLVDTAALGFSAARAATPAFFPFPSSNFRHARRKRELASWKGSWTWRAGEMAPITFRLAMGKFRLASGNFPLARGSGELARGSFRLARGRFRL